ncbi:MAG: sel1 repeat family protein [Myxococcaceae bacterium]|nr:sel1 repeat family protein [Myxococcaceae bacterium]MCI0669470.1 sel1 repeat family protein [Myxococcaceae bacterium]
MVRLFWMLAWLSTAALPTAASAATRAGNTQPGQKADAEQAVQTRADTQCPSGTVKGCVDAAREAEQKGDAPRAATLNTRACDAGVAGACAALGEALATGYGVSRDDAQAARRLQRGCDLGAARACTTLGTLTWQGRGVKADPARAGKLYLRACDGGDATGCFSAGICARTGTCAPRSDAKAKKLLQRACDGGETRACSALGGR